MSTKEHLHLLATYNQWINERIYRSAAKLNSGALTENLGAFFHSVLGTLNHIVVADIIWLKRFAQHPYGFLALKEVPDLPTPRRLDSILFTDFSALRTARQRLDATIITFIDELSNDIIESPLAYKNTKGQNFTIQMEHLLLHFFNHQTHHRGQVTTLLSQLNADLESTDLLELLPQV